MHTEMFNKVAKQQANENKQHKDKCKHVDLLILITGKRQICVL